MSIDTELQANLKKAKSGRMMFAFAHKGSSGSLMMDRKITGKDAAKAKEKAGGGTVFRGRCFGEDGQMIFEVAKEPPAALEAAIRRTINLEAGLSLKVVVRFAADAEAEPSDLEPQAKTNGTVPEAPPAPTSAPVPQQPIPAPPAPPGSEAAFKNRLKAVQAQLQAAGGPAPDQQMLLNQAFSAARDKNYAAALDALKGIDGSKKVPKDEPSSLESTTFKRELANLKPRFDQARVLNSELMPQLGQVMAVAKANRFADALELLDNLAVEVDRTLAAAAKPVDAGAKFKARLKAVLPTYNAAIKGDPALLTKLRPLMGQVIALSNSDQFDKASVFLIQIEKALNIAKPADSADAVRNRFAGLKDAIKAALSAGGPEVARIQTLVGAIGGLLKNKDTTQADKLLDELEPLLKPAGGARGDGRADPGAEWKAKLAEASPMIKAAMAAKGPNAAAIAKLLAQATALSKPGGNMAQALAKLTECHALAASSMAAPGAPKTASAAQPTGAAKASEQAEPQTTAKAEAEGQAKPASEAAPTAQPSAGQDQPDEGAKTPTARWEAAREMVVPKLRDEIKKVVAIKHPKVAKAELELKAVMAQLRGEMTTKQQAVEMERYLKEDDVVAAVCKLAFDLKTPLLKVLAEIKDQLAA